MDDTRITVGDTYDGQAFEEITAVDAQSGAAHSVHAIDGVEVEADVWVVEQKAAREREMEKSAGTE